MDNFGLQFERRTDEDNITHSTDGVDVTLIRWMLSLTPKERLQALQRNIQSIMRLKKETVTDKDKFMLLILERTRAEKSGNE
jgi:hypothetical protein